MSRSRKKVPVHGNTTAPSDKWWKTQNHKKMRRLEREALFRGEEPPSDPSEVWLSAKDGKAYSEYEGWERK